MATRQSTNGIQGVSDYLLNSLLPSISTIRLTNIFDHELTDLAGFPSATVTLTEENGSVLDNARNQRIYKFQIRVFIDRNTKNFGSSKAEKILRTVADEITLKIDADITLNGNCLYCRPYNARFGYIDRQSNNIRLMEIDLECYDAITR